MRNDHFEFDKDWSQIIEYKINKKEEIQMNYTTSKLSTQTASGFKKLITVASVSSAALFVVIPTNAEEFWVGGRIKAGTGISFLKPLAV
jgi:hypothetical protein